MEDYKKESYFLRNRQVNGAKSYRDNNDMKSNDLMTFINIENQDSLKSPDQNTNINILSNLETNRELMLIESETITSYSNQILTHSYDQSSISKVNVKVN
jgi:hypothetical protein